MDLVTHLKRLKAQSGRTTRELAALSGIPEPTLEKLFSGQTKEPRMQTMARLVHCMGGTLDAFYLGEGASRALSDPEQALLAGYRTLDDRGKGAIDALLNYEAQHRAKKKASRGANPPLTVEAALETLAANPGEATIDEIRAALPDIVAKIEEHLAQGEKP